MIAWQTVAILAGFFIALGGAFDRLLATRWKRKLHYRLVHWWNELDETRIPDLFARAAGWIVSRFDHFSPKKRYWLLAYSAGTLVCLTIGSTGALIDSSKSSPEIPALTDVHPDFFDRLPLPHVLVLVAVFPFDFAVLLLTIEILRRVRIHSKLQNLGLILVLLLATGFATVGCFAAVSYANEYAFNHSLLGMRYDHRSLMAAAPTLFNHQITNENALMQFALTNGLFKKGILPLSSNAVTTKLTFGVSYFDQLRRSPRFLWEVAKTGRGTLNTTLRSEMSDKGETFTYSITVGLPYGRTSLFLTGTVCLPVLGLLLFLMILLIGKFVLNSVRVTAMYFLDVTTEPNPKDFAPGALTAVVFSVLLGFIKCAGELVALFHRVGKP